MRFWPLVTGRSSISRSGICIKAQIHLLEAVIRIPNKGISVAENLSQDGVIKINLYQE